MIILTADTPHMTYFTNALESQSEWILNSINTERKVDNNYSCVARQPRTSCLNMNLNFFSDKLQHNYTVICAEGKEMDKKGHIWVNGRWRNTDLQRGLEVSELHSMYWSLRWNMDELDYRIILSQLMHCAIFTVAHCTFFFTLHLEY